MRGVSGSAGLFLVYFLFLFFLRHTQTLKSQTATSLITHYLHHVCVCAGMNAGAEEEIVWFGSENRGVF